jgi:LPXTG-motif cell wall-anchored protein
MGKIFFLLAGNGSKSGIPEIYFVIAAVVLVVAGYFLLRRKK